MKRFGIALLCASTFAFAPRLAHAAPEFDEIEYGVSGGFALFSQSMTLDKDGNATVLRKAMMNPNAGGTWSDKATAAELKAVEDAVRAAKVTSLPDYINDPAPIMDIPSEHFGVTINGKKYVTNVSKAHRYMSYKSRLEPLATALRAIEDRITQKPAAASFQKLELKITNGSARTWRIVSLTAAGKAHFEAGGVTVKAKPPVDGDATKAELEAVKKAFAAADVAGLPETIPGPAGLAGGSVVHLTSLAGGKTKEVNATLGFFGTYESRLEPLVDALERIGERLASQDDVRTITGLVYSSGNNVYISQNKSNVWLVTNEPFKKLLKNLPKDEPYVTATVKVVEKGMFGGKVEVQEIKAKIGRDAVLRSKAGVSGSKIASLKKGTEVTIKGGNKSGTWLEVVTKKGKTGFVYRPLVEVGTQSVGAVGAIGGIGGP